MAWCQESVNAVTRFFQQATQRGDERNVLAEKEKFLMLRALACCSVIAVAGMVVSKTQTEKHDFTGGVIRCQPQGIHRRVDDADVRSTRFSLQ